MLCVIATEPEVSDILKRNLERMYPAITFEVCHNTADLSAWAQRKPTVLLLSRFLPGQDLRKYLKEVPLLFPSTHTVLLVGDVDEDCQAFLRLAKGHGLSNYVTGPLPGDRPYTLAVAFRQERETWREVELADTGGVAAVPGEVRSPAGETVADQDHHQDAGAKQDEQEATEPIFVRHGVVRRGLLVLTVANKGGVGKTTATATLAVALANAGIETIAADLDLEDSNLCDFFGLEPAQGIERLMTDEGGHPVPQFGRVLVQTRYRNLKVLPGMLNDTIAPGALPGLFDSGRIAGVISAALEQASVVIVDTPPGFWAKSWLLELFPMADIVLAMVDQSAFSRQDCKKYIPFLMQMGVAPEKTRIILNRFSPKLQNARAIEKAFRSGLGKDIPAAKLPRIAATIPEDWNAHALQGFKGRPVGLDDARSQWHQLAEEIAVAAGYKYKRPGTPRPGKRRKSLLGLGGLFKS